MQIPLTTIKYKYIYFYLSRCLACQPDSLLTKFWNQFSSIPEDIVQYLIEKGADINSRGKEASTPLHVAAHNGDYQYFDYFFNGNYQYFDL